MARVEIPNQPYTGPELPDEPPLSDRALQEAEELYESTADSYLGPDVAPKTPNVLTAREAAVPAFTPLQAFIGMTPDSRGRVVEIDNPNDNSRQLAFQNMPVSTEETFETEWTRLSPPGGSYSHMQFDSTKNYTLEFDIYWTVRKDYVTTKKISESEMEKQRLYTVEHSDRNRRLLQSWNYPRKQRGWSAGPPKLLLVWPNVITMVCYLVELKIRNERFARSGHVTRWIASVKFEECAGGFMSNDHIRQDPHFSAMNIPRTILTNVQAVPEQ